MRKVKMTSESRKTAAALTGQSYDYVVGNGSSVFVPRCALIHALVVFGLRSADVHHQGAGVRPHGHVGVLVDVKVGPVPRPGEAEQPKPEQSQNNTNSSS